MLFLGCASQNDSIIRASKEREQERERTMHRARPVETTTGAIATERALEQPMSVPAPSAGAPGAPAAPQLTAMDQSNDPEDLRLTQELRKQLVGDSSLSFTAKNVKIISRDGRVTLRGAVSPEERTAIVNRARAVAGVSRVDDMLEVK